MNLSHNARKHFTGGCTMNEKNAKELIQNLTYEEKKQLLELLESFKNK